VALNSLGAEHMLNKNYDQSLSYLNAAINENVAYYKGYYNRGLLYAQTNRMQEALADFTKAIDLKQYPKAYVARANVYYTLHDYPKAITDAQSALKTEPQNIKALYVIATSYDDQNELNAALDYYNKALYFSNDPYSICAAPLFTASCKTCERASTTWIRQPASIRISQKPITGKVWQKPT
jgi:tetratricopeptide (TPR) repeat protein